MDNASDQDLLISVITPTCHRNQDLSLCLGALQPDNQKSPFTYEVIVTDDGSKSTAEELIRAKYAWARWVAGPRRGPAANRNAGARNARGAWVLFLDDDCIPVPGWVDAYATAIHNFPENSVFEGRTVGGPNSQTRSDHESPLNLEGGLLWSCNFAIRWQLFLGIGGFDESFPVAFLEDTDLQFRLKALGHASKFVADACVQHPWRRRKGAHFDFAMAKSLCYFVTKHPETGPTFAKAWGIKRMVKIVTFEFPRNLFRFGDLSSLRVLFIDLVMAFEVTRNLLKKKWMDKPKSNLFQRVARRIALLPGPFSISRKLYLQLLGAKIGGTRIPRCEVPWPHQLQIGSGCELESNIYFKFDGFWLPGPNIVIGNGVFIGRNVEFNVQGRIEIGDDCGIGSNVIFTDHNHSDAMGPKRMRDQETETAPIKIGKNVLVGGNSVVLKGVQIGDGAVIGVGSVVTKSVPSNEIWGGVPARKIMDRPQPSNANPPDFLAENVIRSENLQ